MVQRIIAARKLNGAQVSRRPNACGNTGKREQESNLKSPKKVRNVLRVEKKEAGREQEPKCVRRTTSRFSHCETVRDEGFPIVSLERRRFVAQSARPQNSDS